MDRNFSRTSTPSYWLRRERGYGDELVLDVLSRACAQIPFEMAEWILRDCFAICPRETAYCYSRNLMREIDYHLLVFPVSTLEGPDAVEIFLHEAAHAYLEHYRTSRDFKNLGPTGFLPTEYKTWLKVAEWLGEDEVWAERLLRICMWGPIENALEQQMRLPEYDSMGTGVRLQTLLSG